MNVIVCHVRNKEKRAHLVVSGTVMVYGVVFMTFFFSALLKV